jgi:uncharacterized membrane protein YadS
VAGATVAGTTVAGAGAVVAAGPQPTSTMLDNITTVARTYNIRFIALSSNILSLLCENKKRKQSDIYLSLRAPPFEIFFVNLLYNTNPILE